MHNQNGGFFPQNFQPSPVFQQPNTSGTPMSFQTHAQVNSQHVFATNPGFQTSPQQLPPLVPVMNFIRSTPPPTFVSPRPEQNLPDWKTSVPPQDPRYLPSQVLSRKYIQPTYSQLPSLLTVPAGFQMKSYPENTSGSLNQQSLGGPPTLPMQSHANNVHGSFNQQSPVGPSPFQQQSHADNVHGSFNQRSPVGPSHFQQQSRVNNGNGPFNQQFHNGSSTFQQQAHTNNRNGSFNQHSPITSSDIQQHPPNNNINGSFKHQSSNGSSGFQRQSHYKNMNGSFHQQSPNGSSGLQQLSPYTNRPETFRQKSNNTNNFYQRDNNYRNSNSFYKTSNNNKNNSRQNSWNGSSKSSNRFQGIKKERDDSASKPFSCDPCDRSFDTETELKIHLSDHIKCDSGNCQFEAHAKIVFLHKKMQHVTGYAEKISKLNSAEEIEKWRAERRKRFPTQENIARRQAEQAEKEARGEVIETPESTGQMKRKGEYQGKSRNFKRRRHGRGRNHSVNFTPKIEEDEEAEPDSSDDEPVTKLAMFKGVNAVIFSETDEGSTNNSEASAKEKSESESAQAKICVTESTLDGKESSVNEIITINSSPNGSESDKESSNKVPEEENTSKEKSGPPNLVVYDLSDDDAPIELPSKGIPGCQSPPISQESCEKLPSEKPVNNNQSPKKANGTGFKKNQEGPRKKREFVPRVKEEPKRCTNSLLKVIYADEIKSERNKMFQCIRYIVQNNFFGIGE